MRLKGKATIITGGSRGTGFATVNKFLKEGAALILTAFLCAGWVRRQTS